MSDVVNVNEELAMLLRAHGIAVSNYKEWLLVKEGLPSFLGEIVREFKYEKCRMVQLDVRVAVDSETVIIESFAGIGEDTTEAINDALANFSLGSLHPLLAAFFGQDNDQVTIENWEIRTHTWKAIFGNYTIKNLTADEITFGKQVISTIERLLKGANLDRNIHWARIYYGHVDDENITCEFLLDNNPWESAQDHLSKLDWPNKPEFYGVRLFMIFLRQS